MKLGYKLIAEAYSPQEMVRQAVRAEEAGFDFVEISDHFHPWFDSQDHSGFAWSILAAAAMCTERMGLATGVTCPFIRYHPAVMAQAAATTALLSEDRFTFGVGAGERLNEHVVGRGWPAVRARHEMLRESLEIIRLLWSGGYHSYEGKHLTLEDARVFDLPEMPPPIAVASGGPASARIAAELGDAIFVTEPRTDMSNASTRRRAGMARGRLRCPSRGPPTRRKLQGRHVRRSVLALPDGRSRRSCPTRSTSRPQRCSSRRTTCAGCSGLGPMPPLTSPSPSSL